jgi:hypothetical protein
MDNPGPHAPGTLAQFHLGVAADGMSCAMVFIDDRQHSIACIAGPADLDGFIASLTRAAAEMARRRTGRAQDGTAPGTKPGSRAMNVASANFSICDDDGTILGSLIGDGGQVVGIRLRRDVANELTRDMLRTVRVASAC